MVSLPPLQFCIWSHWQLKMAASTEATILYSHVGITGSWAFTVNCSGKILQAVDEAKPRTYAVWMNPTGTGFWGSVTSTKDVPPVVPMIAYSLLLVGSVQPQQSFPCGLKTIYDISMTWFLTLKRCSNDHTNIRILQLSLRRRRSRANQLWMILKYRG